MQIQKTIHNSGVGKGRVIPDPESRNWVLNIDCYTLLAVHLQVTIVEQYLNCQNCRVNITRCTEMHVKESVCYSLRGRCGRSRFSSATPLVAIVAADVSENSIVFFSPLLLYLAVQRPDTARYGRNPARRRPFGDRSRRGRVDARTHRTAVAREKTNSNDTRDDGNGGASLRSQPVSGTTHETDVIITRTTVSLGRALLSP